MRVMYATVSLALALSSCASARPVDLSSAETWLGPDEAKVGRKLTFAQRTEFYISAESGCILPRGHNIDGSIDPKTYNPSAKDIYSLLDGSRSTGDTIPMRQIGYSIRLDRNYYRSLKPMTRSRYRFSSSECLLKRNMHDPDLGPSPLSNIQIYLQTDRFKPKFDPKWFAGDDVRTFEFKDGTETTCVIRLGIDGNVVERARIDVAPSRHAIPTFEDPEAIDCITRGLFAAFGYTGIVNFSFEQLYRPEDLPSDGVPNTAYIGKLLVGFEKFQIEQGANQ